MPLGAQPDDAARVDRYAKLLPGGANGWLVAKKPEQLGLVLGTQGFLDRRGRTATIIRTISEVQGPVVATIDSRRRSVVAILEIDKPRESVDELWKTIDSRLRWQAAGALRDNLYFGLASFERSRESDSPMTVFPPVFFTADQQQSILIATTERREAFSATARLIGREINGPINDQPVLGDSPLYAESRARRQASDDLFAVIDLGSMIAPASRGGSSFDALDGLLGLTRWTTMEARANMDADAIRWSATLRLREAASAHAGMLAAPGAHGLLDRVPANAAAFVSVRLSSSGAVWQAWRESLAAREFAGDRAKLKTATETTDRLLGFSFENQFLPLVGDEAVLVYLDPPASPLDGVLVVAARDGELAARMFESAAARRKASLADVVEGSSTYTSATIDGTEYRSPWSLAWMATPDSLVVARDGDTMQRYIRAMAAGSFAGREPTDARGRWVREQAASSSVLAVVESARWQPGAAPVDAALDAGADAIVCEGAATGNILSQGLLLGRLLAERQPAAR